MPTASRCTSSTPDLGLLEHYVKKILAAPVYDLAVHTPLQGAPGLSAALGNQVLLKREDLQPTFSFKVRGAYNRLVQLSDAQRQRGVITASAGNHAQGVALAARELGIKATIVMPRSTPELKVQGVRSRDAEVLLHGESFPFALAHALALAQHNGQTFVSPFDDPEVIAGQGTVAMEILRQQPGRLDAIFVPVGGGGLIAGIAAYVKYLRPEVRIIGAQPEDGSRIPGIRKWPQQYLPKIYNPANVDELVYVSQDDAETMCRRLACEEGIFAGISAGGACWVAQQIAAREANATIAFVVCDRGDRYLSTGVFPA